MPSNHLIGCHPLLLLPPIFPSVRVFSSDPVLHIRWPKYWSFSFSISPSSEYSGLISFRIDSFDLLAVQGTLKSSLLHSVFWMLSFKPAFSLSSFTFIKRLFISSSLFCHKGGVICISEVIEISPSNLDSSLYFIHPAFHMMYSAYKLNKQGDNLHTALTYSLPNLKPACCSMPGSNCCFLTCIQISLHTDP